MKSQNKIRFKDIEIMKNIPDFLVKNVLFFEIFEWSDEERTEVQHLIKFMMILVVKYVIDEYHRKKVMKKAFDQVKMMICDICHDRSNPSSSNKNTNEH